MQTPPLDPPIAETAPSDPVLTGYDEQHLIVYLRLLDAAAKNADWRDVARVVWRLDPDGNPDRAKAIWNSHLARAKWMSESGYRHLLRNGASK